MYSEKYEIENSAVKTEMNAIMVLGDGVSGPLLGLKIKDKAWQTYCEVMRLHAGTEKVDTIKKHRFYQIMSNYAKTRQRTKRRDF
jgi:hypothetical protein